MKRIEVTVFAFVLWMSLASPYTSSRQSLAHGEVLIEDRSSQFSATDPQILRLDSVFDHRHFLGKLNDLVIEDLALAPGLGS